MHPKRYNKSGDCMKALIVTINDNVNFNYGNKLQNLAVINVLKRFGVDSDTLNFEYTKFSKFNELKISLKACFMKLTRYRFVKNKKSRFYYEFEYNRKKNFKSFDAKYIRMHNDLTLTNSSDYDFYVIGSDQVWNPDFFQYHKMKKYAYLLSFCDDKKKICFSPSFGVSEIPDVWKEWFKKYLSLIPQISVRENDGVKIVKELTGKDAEVLIDPTLMVSSDEWKKYSLKPKNIKVDEKYILTYFLGNVSGEQYGFIDNLSKKYGLKVINLLDKNNVDLYTVGVSEFIYLISHSEIVITDSFHACVFSILFDKPFYVYPRKSEFKDMSTRIISLLEKFDLMRKYSESGLENDIFEHEYTRSYQLLDIERKKASDFIKKSINK